MTSLLHLTFLLNLLVTTTDDPALATTTYREWRTLEGHSLRVRCLAYSPDGLLASGGKDRRICLWNADGELVRRVDLACQGSG